MKEVVGKEAQQNLKGSERGTPSDCFVAEAEAVSPFCDRIKPDLVVNESTALVDSE